MFLPYGPCDGRCPRDRSASTQKPVTPGWPLCGAGNDPSGCCCAASHVSARSTDCSACRCWSGERTLSGAAGAPVALDAKTQAMSSATRNTRNVDTTSPLEDRQQLVRRVQG